MQYFHSTCRSNSGSVVDGVWWNSWSVASDNILPFKREFRDSFLTEFSCLLECSSTAIVHGVRVIAALDGQLRRVESLQTHPSECNCFFFYYTLLAPSQIGGNKKNFL